MTPNPTRRPEDTEGETEVKGVDMVVLCQTVARVLALLDEGEYTGNMQQDTVSQHDALPDQASASDTREAS